MRRVERKTRREIIWLDSAYLAGILLILIVPKVDGVNTKNATEDRQEEVRKAVEVMGLATTKVDQGVKYSEEAGASLGVIVKGVDDLQLMVQQIASATEEMSATSYRISKDVEQIATISRESSNSSGQTAVASGDLANLAASLRNIVGEFRL